MALKAPKESNNKSFVDQPDLEAGAYPARIVQIIDLGLQPQRPYKGEDKPPAYEISLTYELVDSFMVDEEGNEILDKPRWVSETFPLRPLDSDLATSTKRLNAIDPEGVFEGDFTQTLETPVTVTLVINKKDGKVYTNVANVATMRPRDAAKCPELVNEPRFFDLDEPNLEIFNNFPKWIKEKIQSNLNYKGSVLEGLLGDTPVVDKPAEQKKRAPKKQVEEEPAFDPDNQDDSDVPY